MRATVQTSALVLWAAAMIIGASGCKEAEVIDERVNVKLELGICLGGEASADGGVAGVESTCKPTLDTLVGDGAVNACLVFQHVGEGGQTFRQGLHWANGDIAVVPGSAPIIILPGQRFTADLFLLSEGGATAAHCDAWGADAECGPGCVLKYHQAEEAVQANGTRLDFQNNGTCEPTWGPIEFPREACDGLDNDCNGQIDEGLQCGDNCLTDADCADNDGLPMCVGGTCRACDPSAAADAGHDTHAGCGLNELCCAPGGGEPACVATDPASECTGCGIACDDTAADTCVDRACVCGEGDAACGDETPLCVGATCVQCDAEANAPTGGENDNRTDANAACGDGQLCCNNSCVDEDPSADCGVCGDGCSLSNNRCELGVCRCGVTADCEGTCTGGEGDARQAICNECSADGDCREADRPLCIDASVCRACEFGSQDMARNCAENGPAPICNADGACASCQTHVQCAARPGRLDYCVAAEGACRECNPENANGCNEFNPICSADGFCAPCERDEQCPGEDGIQTCVRGQCIGCDPGTHRGCGEPATRPVCDGITRICRSCGSNDECEAATSGAQGICIPGSGTCEICNVETQEGCGLDSLCCAGADGVPTCVPTDFDGGCEACGQACDGDYASVCTDRQCECGPSGRGCTPDGDVRGERCDATAPDLLGCVECRDNDDCPLSAQCCGGVCTGTGGGPGDVCIGCGVGGDSCNQVIADSCSNRVCVCGVDGACEGNTPVCDHVGGGCVQCLIDGDCLANGLGQQCVNNECVECDEDARNGQLAHVGCEESGAEPICDNGACEACATDGGGNAVGDSQCQLRPGDLNECVGGSCAECAPGVLAEANPLNDGCAPGTPICDAGSRTCRRCQGDNECPGTLLCVGGQCNRCNPADSAGTCGDTLPVCDGGNLRCRACDNDGDCDRAGLPGLCTDDGRCVDCDLGDHRGCQRSQLCCGDLGAQACVAATMAQCGACGVACDGDSTNRCDNRVCECGNSNPSICAGVEPYCVGGGNAGECIACRNDGECVLPGRDECVATDNNLEAFCEVCDPADNAGCNLRSNQPFCKRNGAIVTCSSCANDGECNNHPAGEQCVASGACKTCDPSNDHGCTPAGNEPICSDAFTCTGCRADVECASNALAGDLCHNQSGSCFACDDAAKNGDESDVNCGGRCARDFDLRCADDQRCGAPTDCVSGVCTANGRCAAAACDDGLRNGDETDVDCGGACGDTCDTAEVCAVPEDCISLNCVGGRCGAPVCDDGILNQDETGIDCGGARCGPCANGLGCLANGDCVSTVCTNSTCAVPTCNDGHQNGAETDVDCGGPTCDACNNNDACLADRDCTSLVCRNQQCQAPTCNDLTLNQNETGIDCGGACRAVGQLCPANAGCAIPGDCISGTCEGGQCSNQSCENGDFNAAAGETDTDCGGPCGATCIPGRRCLQPSDCTTSVCTNNICQVATCADGAQNADETDVDCGGGGANDCARCTPNDTCVDGPRDCTSFICAGDVCTVPACDDGVQNQNETDVDCSGVCPALCAPGGSCNNNGDCAEGVCSNGTCAVPTCVDNTQNQDETDTDCGGSCDRCPVGGGCDNGGDCVERVCVDAICAVPTCADTKRNQDETDTDCGGDICDPCIVGAACIVANDCDSGVCIGQECQAPACDDGVNNGTETGIDCGGLVCGDCAAGQACVANEDCISLVCTGQICRAPTCVDQVQNGTETDLDCGGAACRADNGLCATGQACVAAGDCVSGVCSNNICAAAACDDGVLNGDETGADCGGSCLPLACADGLGCNLDKECLSNVCNNNICQVPRCNDGVLNGNETDIDCGGALCAGCSRGLTCALNTDCANNASHCVDDVCQVCDLGDHTSCGNTRLCCVEPGGTPTCQRTGTPNPLNQCQSCDEPCNLDRANVCTARVCMCGDEAECADSYCLAGACGAECLEDAHCANSLNGRVCDNAGGDCGCNNDGDCPDGRSCDMNGVCVP